MTIKSERLELVDTKPKRVIAVGKRINGQWTVRTNLWRFLAATALSPQ